MDQSALEALLYQLKQQDGPEDTPLQDIDAFEQGGDDVAAPSLKIEDVVNEAAEDAEADKQEKEIISVVTIAEPSQLDILLKSLRPVAADERQEDGELDDQQLQPYGAGYLNILNDVRASTSSSTPVTAKPASTSSSSSSVRDIRKFTFAQALPVISGLAADPAFMEALQQLKSQQELLELNIVDERNRAKADLEKQLKAAKQSADAAGRKYDYEVDRLSKLLASTITKFDKAALVRWDDAAKEQQAKLEQLGVPCFYVLKMPDKVAQDRQRRVMEMLHQLLEDN